jgi:hypothetical protein
VIVNGEIHQPFIPASHDLLCNECSGQHSIASLTGNVVHPVTREHELAGKEPAPTGRQHLRCENDGAVLVMVAREEMLCEAVSHRVRHRE